MKKASRQRKDLSRSLNFRTQIYEADLGDLLAIAAAIQESSVRESCFAPRCKDKEKVNGKANSDR